jgi:hypothetical protein
MKLCAIRLVLLALAVEATVGFQLGRSSTWSQACAAEDLAARVMIQNRLAGICEEMCKSVGAYPKCACPAFTGPGPAGPSSGMPWGELNKFMGDLVIWGRETMQKNKQLATIQHKAKILKAMQVSKACTKADEKQREAVQNRLHGICVDMCKELGAYPDKCACPNFDAGSVDKTPGIMTWDELLIFMGDVATGAEEQMKSWKSQAR